MHHGMPPEDETGPYGLSPAHEATCRRCGTSCHPAIPVNGIPVVVPELSCRFLARGEGGHFHCTVYARRFEVAPWCRTVDESLAHGLLAHDCPYAAGIPNYKGKVRLKPRLLDSILPVLRAHVAEAGVPDMVDPEAARRFLEGDGSRWTYEWDDEGERFRFRRRG